MASRQCSLIQAKNTNGKHIFLCSSLATAVFLSAISAGTLSRLAYADASGLRPWLGIGVGLSHLDPDASEISNTINDKNDSVLRGMFGIDLNHRFGIEFSYSDLGEVGLSGGNHVAYYEISGDLLVYFLANKERREHRRGLLPFVRGGVSHMKNYSSFPYERENDISLDFGAGLEYGSRSGLAARAEITSFDVDAHYAGLSLIYRFGGHTEHKQQPLVENAPILQAAAPDAIPEILTLGPILFDTDSHTLNTDALEQINDAAEALRNKPGYIASITGYADLLGSDIYNLKLSQRRADSVIRALGKLGINVQDYTSKAAGETDRFGSMNTAEGRRQNRRVDIIAIPE